MEREVFHIDDTPLSGGNRERLLALHASVTAATVRLCYQGAHMDEICFGPESRKWMRRR